MIFEITKPCRKLFFATFLATLRGYAATWVANKPPLEGGLLHPISCNPALQLIRINCNPHKNEPKTEMKKRIYRIEFKTTDSKQIKTRSFQATNPVIAGNEIWTREPGRILTGIRSESSMDSGVIHYDLLPIWKNPSPPIDGFEPEPEPKRPADPNQEFGFVENLKSMKPKKI